jgi:hypothetical protein
MSITTEEYVKRAEVRTGLSNGKELVANEVALLRDLGVDRRQSSWLTLRKVQTARKRKAPVTHLRKPTAIDRNA